MWPGKSLFKSPNLYDYMIKNRPDIQYMNNLALGQYDKSL